ncbi:MAG: hypothetical protein IPG00_11595 [Saprospiraceae bacterium]|nr:hypothetical protein [Saprospiraceae bacterium]
MISDDDVQSSLDERSPSLVAEKDLMVIGRGNDTGSPKGNASEYNLCS